MMFKVFDVFKAFKIRVDAQTLIRHQKEEIGRLNNTINTLLEKQSRYHEQHVENHDKTLIEREEELRREFQAVLRSKNSEIENIKNKYSSFWEVYEELTKRKLDLEKLRVSILERIELASNFNKESIKSLNITVSEMSDFIENMNKLDTRTNKLIPER